MSRNPLARVIDFALATDRSKVHQYVETIRGMDGVSRADRKRG